MADVLTTLAYSLAIVVLVPCLVVGTVITGIVIRWAITYPFTKPKREAPIIPRDPDRRRPWWEIGH